jgi:hypothetical protein
MGIKSKIAGAAILTLAIAGCASEGTQQAINAIPTAMPVAKSLPVTQSFNNPVVSAKKAPKVASATLSLIQPTNATERVVVVSKGRTDPFAQIGGQTVGEMSNITDARAVPALPPLAIAGRKLPTRSAVSLVATKIPLNQNKVARIPKAHPGLIQVLPKLLPQVVSNPTLVSVLPPPAQPELARAVIVSGVVLLGKEPQAIIKMPNELTSRYVQARQRLANGLLIKRIEMNEGSNPIVILEQYGIEVAKMVGEAPANSTSSATTPPLNALPVGAS